MRLRAVVGAGAVGIGVLAVVTGCDPTVVDPIDSYSGVGLPVGNANTGYSQVKVPQTRSVVLHPPAS